MTIDFKNINIGNLIANRVTECKIEMQRICNFFKCSEEEIKEMYLQEELSTNILLKWSKLLEYDFFRIYSHHLILYSPPSAISPIKKTKSRTTSLPQFKKSLYTREIIGFIIEMIKTGEKTTSQIEKQYGISKSTLYKWREKYINED